MDVTAPRDVEEALAAYYDLEGARRLGRDLGGRRVAVRERFVAALSPCSSVLEVGAGPGTEAAVFADAGHPYVAVDLSSGHARLCRQGGRAVVVASARMLPLRSAAFDAIWSMSTLMHVPNVAVGAALSEVRRVLRPGGIAGIGVWGGVDEDRFSRNDPIDGPPRLFSLRSDDRWLTLLEIVGIVETFETWGGDPTFYYQWALVRR